MKAEHLPTELNEYAKALERFQEQFRLPAEWFSVPDHFAIKCANEADYYETCGALKDRVNTEGLWQIELDERLLGSAQLASSIVLSDYAFEWIEVMQPRPGKELASGFVEHTEFFFPDFSKVTRVLQQNKIDFELQQNPGHGWVNIIIDDHGREIKINDKLLADVTQVEKSEGKLKLVVSSKDGLSMP